MFFFQYILFVFKINVVLFVCLNTYIKDAQYDPFLSVLRRGKRSEIF